jgi:hypothetical protein
VHGKHYLGSNIDALKSISWFKPSNLKYNTQLKHKKYWKLENHQCRQRIGF